MVLFIEDHKEASVLCMDLQCDVVEEVAFDNGHTLGC